MKLKSFMVNSYFFNSYIATDDIFNPNKANIKKESLVVSNQHACDKLFITYKYSTVSMDYGFIFEIPVKTDNIKISNYVPDQVSHTRDLLGYNIIYDVEVDADHFRTTTYVRFMKIQEALASMGGIISILKLVLGLILESINKFSFSFLLFREVYLNGEKYINLDKQINQNEFKPYKNIRKNSNVKITSQKLVKNKFEENNFKHSYDNSSSFLKQYDNNNNYNLKNKFNDISNVNIKARKNKIFINRINYNEGNDIETNLNDNIDQIRFSKEKLKNFLEIDKNPNENITEEKKDSHIIMNDKKMYEYNNKKINDNNYNYFNSNTKDAIELKEIIKSYKRNLIEDKNPIKNKENNLKLFKNQELLKKNNKNIIFKRINPDTKTLIDISGKEISTGNFKINENKIKKTTNSKIDKNNRLSFKISFSNFILSICCRNKEMFEPLSIILEKINKEMEIQSYIRNKEDMHIIKELFFDSNDLELFNKPFDFREIYDSVKNKGQYRAISAYLKNSFSMMIMDKDRKVNRDLTDIERKFQFYREKITKKK